tara:strand:- start:426 stop:566 length:141 start_codon:yes stop_codon:yes gene_type:complete
MPDFSRIIDMIFLLFLVQQYNFHIYSESTLLTFSQHLKNPSVFQES